MDFLTPTYDAVSAAVKAVWPETVSSGSGVWHAMDLRREAFEESAKDGNLPAAAFEFVPGGNGEWGADNNTLEGQLYIYYVTGLSASAPGFEALMQKALAMAQYLRSNDLACGQVLNFPIPRCDNALAPNAFFGAANKQFLAAAAVCEFLMGESP